MPRINTVKRNIACLESLWDSDVQQRLTVEPLLNIVAKEDYVMVSYLSCNTNEELEFGLRTLARRSSYRILYLAFHGSPGEIELGDRSVVKLEELSGLMGTKFKGWVVHFGSCGTLSVNRKRLQRFLGSTQTSMLIGYVNDVDWVQSAAMDLIILDRLQRFKDLGVMWKRVRKDYPDLIKLTGLTVFPRI